MKRKILLTVLFGFCALLAVNAQAREKNKDKDKEKGKRIAVERDSTASDSTEYELVVFDTRFETWLLMKPQNEHSLGYYRSRNKLYVMEWNYRYMSSANFKDLYECQIPYDPNINYGLEFERRLYYYFRYFEEMNHVSLEPGRK